MATGPDLAKAAASRPITVQLAIGTGLVAAYFVAARFGLSLAFVNSSASAVWPPTGIAIAALVLLGLRYWPAILLGAFLANLANSDHVASASFIAAGNTLEGVAGAYGVLRWSGGRDAFERPRNVFRFFVLAGLAAPLISATVGVTTLVQFDLAPAALAQDIWLTWWLGDAAGAVVLGPALILLLRSDLDVPGRRAESIAALVSIAAVAYLIWGPSSNVVFAGRPFSFVTMPFVVWTSLRLGVRTTALAALILDSVAVWGTLAGHGPFIQADPNTSLLYLQTFLGVVALITLPTAALARQQSLAQGQLRAAADGLEQQVRDRTENLRASEDHLRLSLTDAEEARKRFVHLFRSTPMGMLLTRMDASVVDANEAASHLWGYSRDEMLDPAFRTTRFFSDPAERDKLAHAVRTKGGARDLAVRMQRKDGTLRQFLFNVEIIELGGEKLFLSAGNDITQLHEAQEARAKALRSVAEAERIMGRGSWEWDVSTNRAVWSDGMYRLFGLDPATFDNANENFLAMVHPDDRARMGQAIADAMAKPGRFLQEYRLRRPDGEERFIRGEGNVQTTPDGKPHVLYGFVQDVTDLRALEAEKAKAQEDRRRAQERFARVFEASPAPILLSKDDGRIVDANQAFSRLFGYSKAELTAPGFSAVTLYAHAGDRPRLLARLRENALVRDTDLEVVAKDGTRRDVAISMEFIDLGGQTTILSVFLDVTDRKRQQAEREARIASEAELERLRRTDKFRVEFINSTAHELRTPLTPLMASVAILRKISASDPRMQDQLAIMQRAVDRLHRVAEDLVGAADTQARAIALDKRRLSVGRELRAAVASHQATAERNGIQMSDPDDPGLSVVADPQRLQLVLGHLLGNALKFTPAGGRVWLAARRDGDHVRVSVNDTGVGLTRAQMDGLWKPFAQAHDKEQRTDSGSGLGLYVTRGIIEAHGGEVGVSSPGPGKGSTFWFALPLAPGNVDPLLKAPAEPEMKKRGRLTLDGDPDDVA